MAAANYVMVSQSLVVEPGMAGLAELREEMESFRVYTSRAGSDGFRSGQKTTLSWRSPWPPGKPANSSPPRHHENQPTEPRP